MRLLVALVLLFALNIVASQDPGQPLFLSQYLPHRADEARKLSTVKIPGYNYASHSGFLTVDSKANSNTFFWFFKAEQYPETAPIGVWLQGGPGVSSLLAVFSENGPFFVDTNFSLSSNPYRWTQKISMLYIDNPVGVGYSFTDSQAGYSTDQTQIASNLYSALLQFFVIFPELSHNPLYVMGESYGGKYAPSLAYYIAQQNSIGTNYINLVGLSVGDGLMDPATQLVGYGDVAYYFGLADPAQRDVINSYEQKFTAALSKNDTVGAFRIFDELINGDFYPYPTYFYNITGTSDYYNVANPIYPPNPYQQYLVLPSTRAMIHVGNLAYNFYNQSVEYNLLSDWMVSVKYKVEYLLNGGYQVLIYNGQYDVILSAPQCENYMETLNWVGSNQYKSSSKTVWKVEQTDQQVAGYVRSAFNLVQVVVRMAGHLVPQDQPRPAMDMMNRFVFNLPFDE
eukprot:TRINITY_DN5648_c0_g1_i1.p1 TRINITY_DN5648_c0_g1~~TRINITY_DN5648_c0_g1_i1.p1  ORF type:complete len:454 (-),score=97.58 TRINITY_DN5648_c0_g1_i1:85-1446(-)